MARRHGHSVEIVLLGNAGIASSTHSVRFVLGMQPDVAFLLFHKPVSYSDSKVVLWDPCAGGGGLLFGGGFVDFCLMGTRGPRQIRDPQDAKPSH